MKFFSPLEHTKETKNRLPHWQQMGACYFITFRLADSLPISLMKELNEERERWLKHHPKPWTAATEAEFHKSFSRRLDHWLDQGLGSCLLRQRSHREIVSDCLLFFNGKRYALHAFAVMPNHVHILASLHPEERLASILHSWKRQSSRHINAASGSSGRLWQKDYFDRVIRDWAHFERCVRYIRNNPMKAALSEGDFMLYEDEVAGCIP